MLRPPTPRDDECHDPTRDPLPPWQGVAFFNSEQVHLRRFTRGFNKQLLANTWVWQHAGHWGYDVLPFEYLLKN